VGHDVKEKKVLEDCGAKGEKTATTSKGAARQPTIVGGRRVTKKIVWGTAGTETTSSFEQSLGGQTSNRSTHRFGGETTSGESLNRTLGAITQGKNKQWNP